MRTIKFASKVKRVRVEDNIEKREFFYAIVDNHDKYIGFYLEDLPQGLMQKGKTIQVWKDIKVGEDENGEALYEAQLVNEKVGQVEYFNKGGITYVKPFGRFHYLGNKMITSTL